MAGLGGQARLGSGFLAIPWNKDPEGARLQDPSMPVGAI
jgi:hypothetical protein